MRRFTSAGLTALLILGPFQAPAAAAPVESACEALRDDPGGQRLGLVLQRNYVRWSDDELNELKTLHGRNFEVVDTSSLRNG